MNVILFGFTGLGNAVLRGLLNLEDVNVSSVFTKKYPAAYPFYPEIQLEELCARNGIPCFNDVKVNSPETISMIRNESPDLLIVSSFNQIFTKKLIDVPSKAAINFHPSLLPKYRGPCPEQCVILNDEKETGITVHYIAEKIDAGNIILQKKLKLDENETYSSLKKKVATETEALIPEIIRIFAEGKPEGFIQNERDSTYHKRPGGEDCFLENETSVSRIRNKVRALNPFPGTSIMIGDRRIEVDRYEILNDAREKNKTNELESYIDLYINSDGIRLFKKK